MDLNLKKKGEIIVNFSSLISKKIDIKNYQSIGFHTLNKEIMDQLIEKFKIVFQKINLTLTNIEYIYYKEITDVEKKCEYFYMPTFKVMDMFYNLPNILLRIEKTDSPIRHQFIQDLSNLTNLKITNITDSLWFPSRPLILSPYKNKMFYNTIPIQNKYPIYIISKGRWKKRLTQRYLEWSELDYKIVIEPDEYDEYTKVIPIHKILVCPENFSYLGKGSIPVRNFVWKHSINNGDKRHWILDDNIISYKRNDKGDRTIVKGGIAFKVIEDFVDRYTNIKMCGHNYSMFCVSSRPTYPIILNTRIYSSILLSNDLLTDKILDEGWRGIYNEDTDLSLRILKLNYPTILFNTFLADKTPTLSQKGGNTDTIYNQNNSLLNKAESLAEQHSDVAKVSYRFNRVHHKVNYSSFKKLKPIYKDGKKDEYINKENYDYDMKVMDLDLSWKCPVDRIKKTKIIEQIYCSSLRE
jgi:hypothetical protein